MPLSGILLRQLWLAIKIINFKLKGIYEMVVTITRTSLHIFIKNSQSSINMNETALRHIIKHTKYHDMAMENQFQFGTEKNNMAGLNWIRDSKLLPFCK